MERATDDDEDDDYESGIIGGSVRSVLRIVSKQLKAVPMKAKVKIKPKVVAKSADHASLLFDAYNHFQTGHKDNQHYSVHTRKRLVYAKAFFFAAPMYLRSMLLDTALFWCYERAVDRVPIVHGWPSKDWRLRVPLAATATGLCGGAVHGYLTTFWDHKYYTALDFFRHHERAKLNRRGAAFSGGLVFGTLFGGYETSKYLTLRLLDLSDSDEDMSRIEGFSCILFSGLLAGYVSECAAHYTSAFEIGGIRAGLRELKRSPPPALRAQLPGVASSAIGFVAYEYTKDYFDFS